MKTGIKDGNKHRGSVMSGFSSKDSYRGQLYEAENLENCDESMEESGSETDTAEIS